MAGDTHAGMGGSYAINDAGEKVLLHRTDGAVPAAKPSGPKPAKPQAATKQPKQQPTGA